MMKNAAIEKANTIFFSHSHQDQLLAYAFSEWLTTVWPNLHVYLTHQGLSGREQIQEFSYLHATPHAAGMLCLLTQHSMTSNAVFDEMEVALKAAVPIIHIMRPKPSEDDLKVYSYLRELWVPKYGKVLYTDTIQDEGQLLSAISRILSWQVPRSWTQGLLKQKIEKFRSQPPTSELTIPDIDALEMGGGTRGDALMFLSYLEREHDNQMRIRGLPIVNPAESASLPDGVRVARLIFTIPKHLWEQPIQQFQHLVDAPMLQWLERCITDAPDPAVRGLAKELLTAIKLTLRDKLMSIDESRLDPDKARIKVLTKQLADCEQRILLLDGGDLPMALESEKEQRKRLIAELDYCREKA